MLSVYKKELKGYFTTMTGYIFTALILIFAGIFTLITNFFGMNPSIGSSLSLTVFVFLIAVPILTMRSLAEERANKTDLLLLSLPIKTADIVLGKFLAMISVMGVSVAFISLYPIILSFYGNVNFASSYSSILSFFVCGAALIAVGMYISSMTESVVVSATISIGAMLVIYFVPMLRQIIPATPIWSVLFFSALAIIGSVVIFFTIRSFNISLIFFSFCEICIAVVYFFFPKLLEGASYKTLSFFSVTERFDIFATYQLFDIGALIYFISIIALFLFLCIQSVEKRHWN